MATPKFLSDNAQTVLRYLQENSNSQMNYLMIAEGTGLEAKQINGIVNGLARKGLAERLDETVEEKKIIQATSLGLSIDPAAELAE